MLAVKWRNFKVHFAMRHTPHDQVIAAGQGVTHGIQTKPNYPWFFDLENDLKELWDIRFMTGCPARRQRDRHQYFQYRGCNQAAGPPA
jgi:hypothetical protein